MKKETVRNGYVRLTPDEGKVLVDSRNGGIYSEVVCKTKNVGYFSEIDE